VVSKIDKTITINDRKGPSLQVCLWVVMAMYLSTKHPELFSAAGSMSGVADMGSMITVILEITKLMEPVFGPRKIAKNKPILCCFGNGKISENQ
jgi:hypothetical protein